MSVVLLVAAHLVTLAVLPVLVIGVINRTKALWTGRKGLPILQLGYDVLRLVRKHPVYSMTTTSIFRLAPWVLLATALLSGLIAPLLGLAGPLSFPLDFVFFAYVWGLGRVALVLGALDTGSSFEGMGASREATFGALVEPALFLGVGAGGVLTGARSMSAFVALGPSDGVHTAVWVASLVALFILVQVEAARVPIDDPTTHLELTMIHEVMVLDHSGPDLAAIELGSAMKLTVGLSLVAALLNPLVGSASVVAVAAANLGLTLALAVVVGTIESLVARLKMRAVPQYILVGLVAGGIALLATTFRPGGIG